MSDRIKELRIKHGLTQDQFGEICGASKSAVSQWENEDTKPTIDNLMALQARLGFSIDWLLTGVVAACGGDARSQALADLFAHLDERGQTAVLRVAEAESSYILKPEVLHKRSA